MSDPAIKITAVRTDNGEVEIWLGWDGEPQTFIVGDGNTLQEAIVDAVKELGLANQQVLHLTPADVKEDLDD